MTVLEKLIDNGDTRSVTIDRVNIVQDMLSLYSEERVTVSLLNFNFYNEPAVDFDGVKREALSLFLGNITLNIF